VQLDFPNPGIAEDGKPPAKVLDVFRQHDCAKFPRIHRR
jgi:hypothetical protein